MKTVNVKSLGESCPYLISLDPEDKLGEGSYGSVVRAYNKNKPKEDLVVKIFKFTDSKRYLSAFQQLKVVSQLPKHPNLIEYKRVKISSKNYIYVIMERCKQGSLKHKIDDKVNERTKLMNKMQQEQYQDPSLRRGLFDEKQVWRFIVNFVEGYKMLYQNGILHRDIKPENILIGADGKYKICDFGLAELIHELHEDKSRNKPKGSLFFMAPELILSSLGKTVDEKHPLVTNQNDVYSFAVTIYQMCFGVFPYINRNYVRSFSQFIRHLQQYKLEFPKQAASYSRQLTQLLQSMLEKDPLIRCTWEYVFLKVGKIKKLYFPYYDEPSVRNNGNQLTPQKVYEKAFKIVQISDTLLKNLSLVDLSLHQSLKRDSLIIIDHVEAQILSKRDFVFYCDQLYVRFSKISANFTKKIRELNEGKLEEVQTTSRKNNDNKENQFLSKSTHQLLSKNRLLMDLFAKDLLISNFLYSKKLYEQFDGYYGRISKSEFLKVVTSKKYEHLKNIIEQDFNNLQESVSEMEISNFDTDIFNQNRGIKDRITEVDVQVYQQCAKMIQILIKANYYQEAVEVDHLEQWYEKKSTSILFKTRKNDNALRQFKVQLFGIEREDLKKLLSPRYHYLTKQPLSDSNP